MKNLIVVLVLLVLTGCADTVAVNTGIEPVGFWYGLWHGAILPISWIVSLFSDDVAIYAMYNSGGWYDFGFVAGLGIFGGGCSNC